MKSFNINKSVNYIVILVIVATAVSIVKKFLM